MSRDLTKGPVMAAFPTVGVLGIRWSVPIGWLPADAAGPGYYLLRRRRLFAWDDT